MGTEKVSPISWQDMRHESAVRSTLVLMDNHDSLWQVLQLVSSGNAMVACVHSVDRCI